MNRSLKLIGVMLAGSLAAFAYACGGDDSGGGGGKGGSGGTGGGTGGSGGGSTCNPSLDFTGVCKPGAPDQCCGTTIPVMKRRDKNDNLLDPDWSCIGIGTAGTGGAGTGGTGTGGAAGAASGGAAGAGGAAGGDAGPTDAGSGDAGADAAPTQNVFQVTDFSNDEPVADIEVELYEGESIFGKTAFKTDFTKGPDHPGSPELNVGEFYFDQPKTSSLLSYRVKEKVGVAKEFVGFGYEVPPAPAKVNGNTLSPTLYEQLASFAVPLVGWVPPEDLAIVTGPIRDCAGEDVGGARIKFIDESTGTDVPPGCGDRDVRYIYFDGQYPNPKCAYTDYRQSLWIIANATANAPGTPGAGKKFRVEYWGRLRDSDTDPVKFAEKSIEIFQNTVNVHEIRPNVQQK